MRRWVLVLVAIGCGNPLFAQEPPQLKLPQIKNAGDRFDRPAVQQVLNDPVVNYANRHEAAVAALQAAYKASAAEHNRDRATRLLLVAIRRDPDFAKAFYDIALLCVNYERWQDALDFYGEVLRKSPDPQLLKLTNAEIHRVQAIAQLDSTADGKKRRQFDAGLVETLNRSKDPIVGLSDVGDLAKVDPSRWEAPALAGIFHAESGSFPESLKDLEDAARLAPASRRLQIQSAAQVARSESTFTEQKNNADGLWEKQQYELAAKMYASAWENSPSRLDVAMEAATGFLMADQVPLAVQTLSRMRDYAAPELDRKLVAMLKELGAISDSAKDAAAQPSQAAAGQSVEPAARIRSLVGELTTPQMELAVKPSPPLLNDTTRVIPVQDDEINSPNSDMALLSTDSVYAMYRRTLTASAPAGSIPSPAAPDAGAIAAPPATAEPPVPPVSPGRPSPLASSATSLPVTPASTNAPAAATLPPPAAAPSSPAPPPANLEPPASPGKPSRVSAATTRGAGLTAKSGPTKTVSVTSSPAGATVVFDDTPGLNCLTPCEIPLPAGRHTLRATLDGHHEALRIFSVEKKAVAVQVILDSKRGSVSVESAPGGLPIFVNGKKTENVTPALITLDEGDWEIGVEAGGNMEVKKITVKDGDLMRVTF